MSRPCHVFDYDGEYLASFADWDVAHAWARLQALMNGVPAPLEVEDRHRGVGCRVWADRCETTGDAEGLTNVDAVADIDDAVLASWGSRDLVPACVGARGFPFTPPRPRLPS